MLTWMREKAPIIMAVAILAFVGTTMYFAKAGNSGMSGGKKIGKLGKEKISYAEFDAVLRRYDNTIKNSEERKTLAKNVWDLYTNDKARLQTIKEMKLEGTDQEVFEYILNIPHEAFTSEYSTLSAEFRNPTTGVFDTALYRSKIVSPEFLNREDVKAIIAQIEKQVKSTSVPDSKLQFLLFVGKNPSKSEIEVEYRRENEKIVFEYLTASLDSVAVDSNEVTTTLKEKYYTEHKADFEGGERAAVEYIKIKPQAGKVDEDAVIAALNRCRGNVLNAAAGEERDNAFLEEVNFETENEQSKKYGGMFGTLTKGTTRFPYVEEAVLKLAVGDVSEPIKIDSSYHIFYVTARTDSSATVKHIVKNIVLSHKTLDKVRTTVNEMVKSANIAKESTLKGLAAKNELAICDTSDFFTRGEYSKELPYFSTLGRLAFEEDMKTVTSFEGDDVFYIVKPYKRVKKGLIPLVDVDGEVAAAVTEELKMEKAKLALTTALAKVTDSLTLDSIAKENPVLSYAKIDTLSRAHLMRNMDGVKIASTAFASPEGSFSKPFEIENGAVVVKPLYKSLIDTVPESVYSDKEMVARIKSQVKNSAYLEWIKAYKQKLGVEEDLNKFYF